MNTKTLLEHQWPYLVSLLPEGVDLDETAKATGALLRKRQVSSAEKLLRLVFAYALCGMPLRQTAAWAEVANVASISNVALLKRLRGSADWLGYLLAIKLAEQASPPSTTNRVPRVRLVDATTVRIPGSRGTDWRIHLGYDLLRAQIDSIELTDVRGGETLTRFRFQPGELVLGDRGYAHRPGLYWVVHAGGTFIIRHNWSTVPLGDFDLFKWLREIPDAEAQAADVSVAADRKNEIPSFPVRLVAARKSEAAAEKSRRKAIKTAAKKGKQPDPRTLEAAGYIMVLTTVQASSMSPDEILDWYRFRWQVEIAFKRLKGLIHLGEVPMKDPDLARTYLFAKLLGALMLDDLTERFLGFSPWGYRLCRATSGLVDHPAPALH